LLDDDDGEDGDVVVDDTSSDGLSLSLSISSGSVTGVTVREKESDSVGEEDTLLHRETLLVVTTSDSEDVSLPFISNGVSWDFLSHPLFHKDSGSSVIFQVDELLSAGGWVSDV